MSMRIKFLTATLVCAFLTSPHMAAAQTIPPILVTPDSVETRIGTLEFKDGAPSAETAAKVYDTLDFTTRPRRLPQQLRRRIRLCDPQGLHSVGAEDNTVVIFSELMDSKSLFLTANADTVYYIAVVDLTKGPMVVEQPPKALGTINDMWFGWIIDIGFPGPDRGEGGKYLLVPPGYDGPLPEGGFYVARSKTTRVLYAARAFLVEQRSEAGRRDDQEDAEDLSLHAGRLRHEHRDCARRQASGSQASPPVPPTKFVEASGKSFNTIPPSDFSFFEMINAQRAAGAGRLARPGAHGAVGGDRHRQGQAIRAGRADAARSSPTRPRSATPPGARSTGAPRVARLVLLPRLDAWANMLWQGGANFETPPPMITKEGMFKPLPPTGARTLDSRTAFYYGYTLDSPGMIMRLPGVGSQYLMGFLDADKNDLRRRQDLQGDAAARTFPRQRSGRSRSTTTRRARCSTRRSAIRAPAARAIRRPPPKRTPTAPRRSISARPSPTASSAATGFRPCPARAGSRSCASTARSSRSSPRSGGRARSKWYHELCSTRLLANTGERRKGSMLAGTLRPD